jgi:membrane fusion protein, multidrug efflux system
MKKNRLYYAFAILIFMASCQDTLESKKAELVKLKDEAYELKIKINELEKEIAILDPDFTKDNDKSPLVSVITVEKKPFQRKIDVRGTVESRRNVTVSAESMGTIQRISVKEGDVVQQGQVIMQIESDVLRNNIVEVKTALTLAETLFEKQSNLWKNGIGTEMQYLQAKNNKESLEKKLNTLQSQLKLSTVKAPFSGTIERLAVREGEMASPGFPLLRLVSLNDMYLNAEVSERFVGKFKKGDAAELEFGFMSELIPATVYSVGQVINDQNRTFSIEVSLPAKSDLFRPNQVGVVKLKDYENPEALIVPSEIIQKDSKGEYVFVVEKSNDKSIASKRHITRGVTFKNETEILEGLKPQDQVVFKGYRSVSEGASVKIAE